MEKKAHDIHREIVIFLKKSLEIVSEKNNYDFTDKDYATVEVTHPDILEHGDFTSSFALPLSRLVSKNPRQFAEEVLVVLQKEYLKNDFLKNKISSIKIAGPGFVNIKLSANFYAGMLKEILKKEDSWGKNILLKKKTYLSEKTAPNLFKPFHVGHLVNVSFGECLTRIFEHSSAKTISLAYPSDVSLGIAKAVWSLIDQKKTDSFTVDDMGKAYARGTQKYEESEEIKKRIIEINKNIYSQRGSLEWDVYRRGSEINIDYFKLITKRLGTDFDHYIFESESGKEGLPLVKKYIGKVFEKSKEAVIYDGESKGLHTRVFINSEGLPTYESKDIGLLLLKFQKFSFDKSFVYTDMEQQKYFEVIKSAVSEINSEWSSKSEYLQHGRLNFVGGKISSRYGNVPLAEDLIDTVKQNIFEIIKEKDFSDKEKDEMAEKIAIGALKYSFLKVTMGKNMIFDFKKSLDFSGNSGPYLQYSYVRAMSILKKSGSLDIDPKIIGIRESWKEISPLEQILYRFPEKVENALKDYSPHHIANYLYDLASEFNSFYAHTKILDTENKDYKYNLAVTKAFAQTMKNGLYLLGIDVVDKM